MSAVLQSEACRRTGVPRERLVRFEHPAIARGAAPGDPP
jgi:hypothetical protein